jgi:hypothetical protein
MQLINSGKPTLFAAAASDKSAYREKFQAEPFCFHHHLSEQERFSLESIRALARRLPRKYHFSGAIALAKGWSQPDAKQRTFEDTLDHLEESQGWIILKKLQADPEYANLVPQCLSEVEQLADQRLEPLIESSAMSLILTSPHQVTPYHIDADCNFLFQIQGCKTFYVFNGLDRSVLPEQEEERFWSGDQNAAQYREENQAKAWTFALEPGNGVHVPVIYPHWVKNADNISISLSINFRFHGRLRGNTLRMNHFLRGLGLQPRPFGQSRLVDSSKAMLIGVPRAGIHLIRRFRDRAS